MATKHQRRTKDAGAELFARIRRWLEKGDFKQALKDSKVCYRQQPCAEARQLLERAYLARGRQLYRAGLQNESRAVVEGLLELGATEVSVRQELPELLIALGLFDRVGGGGRVQVSMEEGSPAYSAAADHAVLRPERAPASFPAIRQGAETIRRALGMLESGDEVQALAELKEIPRGSAYADWKYFIRGLAAHYRGDAAETDSNWERLEAGRFAARIALRLRALADARGTAADGRGAVGGLGRLANKILGGPVLSRLHTLQEHLAAGRWRESVRLLKAEDTLWRRVDPALPQRLAAILSAAMIRKGAPDALRGLSEVAEPQPMDPRWNRSLAMAWERSDEDDFSQVQRHWRAYLKDLAGMECLSSAERCLAQALVWLRLGRLLAEESGSLCPVCGICHEPEEELQLQAIECFENSLKLAPELLTAYEALADAYREWDRSEEAVAACRRLIERFPEHLETLVYLVEHYIQRDEPLAAREHVFRARRLKPLDPKIKDLAWAVHIGSARHYALAGRWEEGRAEFAAAETVGGPHAEIHQLLVRRAAFEWKAGDLDLAHRLLDDARDRLGEAGPIGLLMAIESRRYALPQGIADEFDRQWLASLKKGLPGAAIGEMCRTLTAHLAVWAGHAGCDDHAARLVEFLRRRKRIKWEARDLRRVLDFLIAGEHCEDRRKKRIEKWPQRGSTAELLVKLAAQARKEFPQNAFFQYLVGELEIRKGPSRCNVRLARDCLRRTVQLAEGAGDADAAEAAKNARQRLDFLDQVEMFPLNGAPLFPLPSFEDDEDEPDEGLFDRFDIGEGENAGQGPGPFGGGPPGELFNLFTRLCRSLGYDPEEVLEKAAAEKPFKFRAMDPPEPRRSKGK